MHAGMVAYKHGHIDEAERAFRSAMLLAEKSGGKDTRVQGKSDKAAPLLKRALEIREAAKN